MLVSVRICSLGLLVEVLSDGGLLVGTSSLWLLVLDRRL